MSFPASPVVTHAPRLRTSLLAPGPHSSPPDLTLRASAPFVCRAHPQEPDMLAPRLNVERLATRTALARSSSSGLAHRLEPSERLGSGHLDGEVFSVRLSMAEDNLVLLRLAELDSASLP